MAVLLALSIWGRALVALVPAPVLACVVIASLFHALNPAPLVNLWRLRRDEVVATAASIAVLVFGVLDGMLMAIALSLLALLQRFSDTRVSRLGQMPGTHDFVDLTRNPGAATDPAILVVRPMEPLFFANAERVFAALAAEAEADATVHIIILSLEESPDFDSTALAALLECDGRLQKAGKKLILARVKDTIRDLLGHAGAHDLASETRNFWSVADAFAAARDQAQQSRVQPVAGIAPGAAAHARAGRRKK
jgi:MFS superfamily sulfate permease-like transporter